MSFLSMQGEDEQYLQILSADPATQNALAFTSGGRRIPPTFRVELIPLEERKANTEQIIRAAPAEACGRPRRHVVMQAVQDVRIGARTTSSQYQYSLEGENVGELEEWAPRLWRVVRGVAGLKARRVCAPLDQYGPVSHRYGRTVRRIGRVSHLPANRERRRLRTFLETFHNRCWLHGSAGTWLVAPVSCSNDP